MAAKPSVIKCPKCGYEPNILGDTCLQCGARLEKACGECGFANSVEKNYCDQCGAVLALKPPAHQDHRPPAPEPSPEPAPQPSRRLELESLQDAVSTRGDSFRAKAAPPPPPAPGAKAAPAPGQPAPPGKTTSVFSPDSSRLMKDAPLPHTGKAFNYKRLAGPAFTLMLAGVLLTIIYMILAPSLPKLRLQMTAKSYLANISKGNFEKAYEQISSNSRMACSLEEYLKYSQDYYAKAPAWEFKDVEVFAMTPEAAMIRYQLREAGSDWKPDYISFVREGNRWARPYIWILFGPIDEAIRKRDYPQALFLSQKLYLTDPVDPRSSAYLCASEFLMGLYEKSAESCKRTVETAAVYPAGYVSDNMLMYHLHYADSLRFLQRDRVALAEYEKLLKWPGLTPEELCPLRLNRGDSYVYLKEYDKALQEVMAASAVCSRSFEKDEAKKRLNYMSGSAGQLAVAFAQKSRFQPGQPPIAEARARALEDMKKRLGPKNVRLLPKDNWLAVHVAGPEYRVFLQEQAYNPASRKTETKDIYIFLINLWTNKARVEKGPQPAQQKK